MEKLLLPVSPPSSIVQDQKPDCPSLINLNSLVSDIVNHSLLPDEPPPWRLQNNQFLIFFFCFSSSLACSFMGSSTHPLNVCVAQFTLALHSFLLYCSCWLTSLVPRTSAPTFTEMILKSIAVNIVSFSGSKPKYPNASRNLYLDVSPAFSIRQLHWSPSPQCHLFLLFLSLVISSAQLSTSEPKWQLKS